MNTVTMASLVITQAQGTGGDQRGIEPCSSVSKTHPKGRRGWNKETFFSEHKPAKKS